MIATPIPHTGHRGLLNGAVVLDLNTQVDLFTPTGSVPVYQAEKLAEPLKKFFSFIARTRIPVVSTRLHDIANPRFERDKTQPKHLFAANSAGQQKIPSTLLKRRQEMPADCGTSLPVEGFQYAQQWIFDIPEMNLFECPRLDRLLSESEHALYLILGGPLEQTVRTAVLGLLQRRAKVAVISDCLGMWDPYEGDMALRQIESKNIEWYTTEQAIEKFSAKPPRPVNEFLNAVPKARPNTGEVKPIAPAPLIKGKAPTKPAKREFRV